MEISEGLDVVAPRAIRLLREGRIEDAIVAYVQLLKLRPSRADDWFNLAFLQRQARRFEDALLSYEQALAHGIQAPEEVHVNRAAILSEYLERDDLAEKELQTAIVLRPGYRTALLNLGNLYEDRGHAKAARNIYHAVLTNHPADPRAIARLAALDVLAGNGDAAIKKLKKAITRSGISAEDASELGFALGHALDAVGSYNQAFAAYATANRASVASAGPMGIAYDRIAQERVIDQIIAAFPTALAPLKKIDSTLGAPIFICGMFRSGSTLVENILASHRHITNGGEMEILPDLTQSYFPTFPLNFYNESELRLTRFREDYVSSVHKLHPNAYSITDKRPDNFLLIGLIKSIFPDAKVINTVRNTLDNIISVYFLNFQHSVSYGFNLTDICHWYQQYRRLMAHWKNIYGNGIVDVDYDAVVTDPEPKIRALLASCDLAWDDACLSPHLAKTVVRTASAWQVRQPLHSRSSGRAKNYTKHLSDIIHLLSKQKS